MNGIKSLDDFLAQGKASGKRWASGSQTTVEGYAYSSYGHYIQVTGLSFTPARVICWTPNYSNMITIADFLIPKATSLDGAGKYYDVPITTDFASYGIDPSYRCTRKADGFSIKYRYSASTTATTPLSWFAYEN